MLKLKELREGDYVRAEFEGQWVEGSVRELHRDDDNQVLVETPVQQFWFNRDELAGIPLNEEQLFKLGFSRENQPDGKIKYLYGPFRILIPSEGDFSAPEMWYREDHRKLPGAIYVHELQNHYHQMTKVDLVREEVRTSL